MDVDPTIRCLFHCPLIIENLLNNQSTREMKEDDQDDIFIKFQSLLKQYYIDNKLSLPSSTKDIISDTTHWIHSSVRTENTISKLIKFFLDKICKDSYQILNLPIPRSTYSIIMTVINLQLHADPNKYESTSIKSKK